MIRFDLRGYGRSDVPGSDFPWSFERYTADVFAVLGTAGHDRCHFVGESMGGTIGLYIASHYPGRVAAITAASTAYRGQAIRDLDDWAPTLQSGGSRA